MEPHDADRRTTSREQVSRIDRGYYRRASPLRAWRTWLCGAGLVAAAAWTAWGWFDGPRHLAPGPVVAAHARWERDCNACHVPFTPIKENTWLSTAGTRAAMDAKCEACHRSAAHHPLEVAAEVGSCASCHADHQGRGADISRVADHTCTACHADITKHRLPALAGAEAPAVAASAVTTPITRFDDEHHPPFVSLAADPGKLKFSHGRHMTAGLVFGGPAREGPFTYAKLAPADRPRLMPSGAAAADLVQLSCASCHEFASTQSSDEVRQVSTAITAAQPGAYALPVSFERHCVACHALPYDPAAPDRTMPHGLDAEATRRFLVTALLEASAAGQAALDAPPRPDALPANVPADTRPLATLRDELRGRVDVSRTFTRGVCGKCHEVADARLPAAALLHAAGQPANDGPETWFRVPPVGVPAVWLTKSRFDHVPHRAFDCRQCHAAAYPDAAGTTAAVSPIDNATVMIAGRESCTGCHAPAGVDAAGRTVGGVRFDCVECHGYHGLGPHGPTPAHALVPGVGGSGGAQVSR
ncbi:MAG: hypothetical protein ACKONH_04455 [Planctomycetia bacterium]